MLTGNSCQKKDDNSNPTPTSGTITDVDGNVYHTVIIGTQEWIVENLKVTHFRNGDHIPNIADYVQWQNDTIGAYCNYNNDENYVAIYGRLYNYYAVADTRNLCPSGWHIPTKDEWTILITYLGGYQSYAGGKMKEAGTSHWLSPNNGATNESGFTGLPGGGRDKFGKFGQDPLIIVNNGFWWSSTRDNTGSAYNCNLCYDVYIVDNYYPRSYLAAGLSVRCVRDTNTPKNSDH